VIWLVQEPDGVLAVKHAFDLLRGGLTVRSGMFQ
jgi:hypothetical protein